MLSNINTNLINKDLTRAKDNEPLEERSMEAAEGGSKTNSQLPKII